jgi:hypothetical protein
MPELQEAIRRLTTLTREAMRRRRQASPGTEAYRRADELVVELVDRTLQLSRLLESRQPGRQLQPVHVRIRG